MADENNQNNYPPQESNSQQYYTAQPVTTQPPEKASVGLAILSYLIPIVGLILYLTKKDDKPKTAKVCGKCALASFIINIAITVIMYAVMGAAMFSGFSDDDSDDESNSSSISAESDDKDNSTSTNTLGDYGCEVVRSEKCKDWEGKDAILVTYNFTNNSDSAISFDIALDATAYQDGVGLESAILDDDTDILDVEIKPGVTKEVKKAYVLRDTTTDVEIEVSEFLSFSDDKLVTTITL